MSYQTSTYIDLSRLVAKPVCQGHVWLCPVDDVCNSDAAYLRDREFAALLAWATTALERGPDLDDSVCFRIRDLSFSAGGFRDTAPWQNITAFVQKNTLNFNTDPRRKELFDSWVKSGPAVHQELFSEQTLLRIAPYEFGRNSGELLHMFRTASELPEPAPLSSQAVILADRLLGISTMGTYPEDGYEFQLKNGIGLLELGDCKKTDLAVLAMKLIA